MHKQRERVLVLSPHTDDAELGCGATIARWLAEGHSVDLAIFSTAEASLPPTYPRDQLLRECQVASQRLGIAESQLHVSNYEVRTLSYHRQEILEQLIALKKALQPTLVLTPASTDVHQDHQTVFQESLRAFKDISLWGYELPWNHIRFTANGFVTLQEAHLEAKWAALQAYQSQIDLGRPYFEKEFVWSLARIRGTQIRQQYAEAYEIARTCI